MSSFCLLAFVTVAGASTAAQSRPPQDPLLRDPNVTAARQAIRSREPDTLNTQVGICEIPAPPFGEAARARRVRELFSRAGLERVRIDRAGNVIGERGGGRPGPATVLSAHLDTVFPRGTDTRVTRRRTELAGPGISDDCRGLAVMIAVARVLSARDLRTERPLLFVATVGEEGLGDLRGVRHLFAAGGPSIGRFISLDGGGLGIVSRAVGSRRYRVRFAGPGGHSYGNFGMASPIGALGRAIAAIDAFTVPSAPKTTFNVGRIGGGTSVNAIAADAWMEVDLRSSGAGALEELDGRFQNAVNQAVADENARWGGRPTVTAEVKRTGIRPAGETAADDPLVVRAVALTAALGMDVSPGAGSTDANIPMSLGIPAITMGAGGTSKGAHSPDERFDSTDSVLGTERALLVTLAAAGGPS